jgi:hypothetical protein
MLCSTVMCMGMREILHWQGGTYCRLFGGQVKVSTQFSHSVIQGGTLKSNPYLCSLLLSRSVRTVSVFLKLA